MEKEEGKLGPYLWIGEEGNKVTCEKFETGGHESSQRKKFLIKKERLNNKTRRKKQK